MPGEIPLYIGSIVIAEMSDAAWATLGVGDHEQVVTQLRYPNGNEGIGASLILNSPQGAYILAIGSYRAEQIYEVRRRLSKQELLNLARLGMSGMVPSLLSSYDDPPLLITLKDQE